MTAEDHPAPCLLGLDLGTSAIKGVLINPHGVVLAERTVESRFVYPQEGWVEVDPESHYRHVCRVIRELGAAAPGGVAALAMAAASGNTLLTDAQGGPLTNVISWMDGRAEQQPPAVLAGLTVQEVARVTGWPCVTSFPLAHLAWLREHRPDVYASAGHYGMDTDWLMFRLTGNWRMDHSTATTFHLQDQRAAAYHAPFLARLGIPPDKLSRLVPCGLRVGSPTPAACRDTGLSAATALVSGCFDHPAAARAVGVLAPGQLMFSCGTSWVGFTPCADRETILACGMLCDPFLSARGGPWGGLFSVPCIGRTIDWYVHHVIAPGEPDPMRVFNEAAAEAAPGAGGLTIDLREAPRSIPAHRRDVSRAVMEGAARLLNDKLRALQGQGFRYDSAVMVGGPAQSPLWASIVAETTGVGVTVGLRSAGACGAALLAGIGAGVYADEYAARKAQGRRSEH